VASWRPPRFPVDNPICRPERNALSSIRWTTSRNACFSYIEDRKSACRSDSSQSLGGRRTKSLKPSAPEIDGEAGRGRPPGRPPPRRGRRTPPRAAAAAALNIDDGHLGRLLGVGRQRQGGRPSPNCCRIRRGERRLTAPRGSRAFEWRPLPQDDAASSVPSVAELARPPQRSVPRRFRSAASRATRPAV
jgi:hypothetical protein